MFFLMFLYPFGSDAADVGISLCSARHTEQSEVSQCNALNVCLTMKIKLRNA